MEQRLRRDTAWVLMAQAFYKLSGFALLMVLARRLGAQDIGAFFFAIAFAESFVVIANFGMSAVMARRVAANPADAAARFAPVLGFRILSSPVYLIVVMAVALLFTHVKPALILATAVIALVEDTYFAFGGLFLALRKPMYNVALGVTIHAAYVILFLVTMLLAPSLTMLLGVTMLRVVCLVIAGAWITQSRLFPLRATWDTATVRAALPFVLIAALHVFRDQIGTLVLGTRASYTDVAHFNLAWRLVASSYFVPTAVCAVFVPLLTAHGLTTQNRRLMIRAAGAVAGIGLIAAAIAWFLANPIASVLYGPMASTVAPLLRALAVVFPLGFMAFFLSLVLQSLYEEAHVLRALILVTAANLTVNWILVPKIGAMGAVYAQVISTSLQLVILALRLRHIHIGDRRISSPEYTVLSDGSP
jgi:O-antigen/teichoic acid export membrane protein